MDIEAKDIGQWVHTDESEDVAASVRHALRCIQFTPSDPQAWKWVALALHSALQGACVCHLLTTAHPIGAITERNTCEWLKYFEESRIDDKIRAPRTYLLSLPDLLKAIRKPQSAGDGSNDSGITLSDNELQWLCRFHDEVRNQFVHFEPMGWSIEVSGIPDVGKLIARLIGEISDMGWAFRHQEQGWLEAMRLDLALL